MLLRKKKVNIVNKSIEKFKEYYLKNNELVLFLNFESSLINNFHKEEKNYCFTEVIDKVEIVQFFLEIIQELFVIM